MGDKINIFNDLVRSNGVFPLSEWQQTADQSYLNLKIS